MTFNFLKAPPKSRVEQEIRLDEWDSFINDLDSRSTAERVARQLNGLIYHRTT